MTKIELCNVKRFFPTRDTGLSVRAQLYVLHRHAVRLRSLKIDLHLNKNENRPQGAFLSGLWDRLNYIEARFTLRSCGHGTIEGCLIAIAPLTEWKEGEVRMLDGCDVGLHGIANKVVKNLPQWSYWLSGSQGRMRELGSA